MRSERKHALVTGASGFIGSRLVTRLADFEGIASVTSLIRSQERFTGSMELSNNQKISSITGDLLEKDSLKFQHDFDAVYHLAALTPLERNKKTLRKVNYDGTMNLFDSLKVKTKSFIYVSGTAVFSRDVKAGSKETEMIDEDSQKNPDTEFVKIRLEAEQSLRDGCKDNGIDFAVVYLPDIVYGNGGSFRSMFLQKIRAGKFRVPGTGDYVKPLIHLDDAVGFLIAILANNAVKGSYIATDSAPVAFGEFVNFIADQLRVRHPSTVPAFLAEIAVGKDLIKMVTRSTAKISNEKMKQLYELRYPSYREGIVDVVRNFISR